MPPEGMAESPIAPHGRTGSSSAPKHVAPYILLSFTVFIICIHDGKVRDLDARDPKGSDASRETHGHPPCKGAEGSLGSPETLELFAS
ncbi:hypothetical protein CDL15_Pgr017522 [Punica granatum]|uniref:Uncharacterized protein n=1 Tax=Punica granatum TaxID=22663 RepID=A0A218W500_PUNGR|nr:hypothetical protein CDL15_Pgr017522 [Punica granatum]